MKRVEVSMVDMEHDDFGWTSIRDMRRRKQSRYRAVGYVVKRTKRYLLLAPVMTSSGSASFCAYRIPRGAIRSVRRLRP